MKRAAIYLRVSTSEQAARGDAAEGYSIPAQREACRRQAEVLGAEVVQEYVDAGESARSAQRPALQRLLRDLHAGRQFDFLIVHKIDRLARSLPDDVMIRLALKQAGAELVSVTESIDASPAGQLLHGIMASFSEYYSRNLAAEALKGATEKAKKGGTPYRAPIGYRNVIQQQNGHEWRTIVLDPERAPLIRWAFERYATGQYTMREMARELTAKGLSWHRVRKREPGPIHTSLVGKILGNRYYMGRVRYCGVEYPGQHPPLVSPAVFAAAEAVRESHRRYTQKTRRYLPPLKGLLQCGRCQRRLGYSLSKGKYGYFYCLGRQNGHFCDLPYLPVPLIEECVAARIRNRALSQEQREALRTAVGQEFTSEMRYDRAEVERLQHRVKRLLREQQHLMEALYADALPLTVLRDEQNRVEEELAESSRLLREAEDQLATARERRHRALELVEQLQLAQAYRTAPEPIQRMLLQGLFEVIVLVDEGTGVQSGAGKDHKLRIVSCTAAFNLPRLVQAVLALSA